MQGLDPGERLPGPDGEGGVPAGRVVRYGTVRYADISHLYIR